MVYIFSPLNLLYRVTRNQTVTDPRGVFTSSCKNSVSFLQDQLILTIKLQRISCDSARARGSVFGYKAVRYLLVTELHAGARLSLAALDQRTCIFQVGLALKMHV